MINIYSYVTRTVRGVRPPFDCTAEATYLLTVFDQLLLHLTVCFPLSLSLPLSLPLSASLYLPLSLLSLSLSLCLSVSASLCLSVSASLCLPGWPGLFSVWPSHRGPGPVPGHPRWPYSHGPSGGALWLQVGETSTNQNILTNVMEINYMVSMEDSFIDNIFCNVLLLLILFEYYIVDILVVVVVVTFV